MITIHGTGETTEINMPLIRRLMSTWPKRASVRGCYFDEFKAASEYDASLPDYPPELVPFWNHPKFEKLDDELKFRVLTGAWIVYNIRTIHAEEKIVNPSLERILKGAYPGTGNFELQSVVYQSLIDERFHSYMHYSAMHATMKLRSLKKMFKVPETITYRMIQKHQYETSSTWHRQLIILASGIISETSINSYLSLLSGSEHIQKRHSLVSRLHDLDEFAHSSLLVEIAKAVFQSLDIGSRRFFIDYLPKAMDAFCAQDFEAWRCVLQYCEIPASAEIIADCESEKSKSKLVNEHNGLKRIAEELNIEAEMKFDFSASGCS